MDFIASPGSPTGVEHICAELSDSEEKALAVPTDVSDHEAFATLISKAVEAMGCVGVSVNNTGLIDPISRIMDSDPVFWGAVLNAIVKGAYYGLRYAMAVMARKPSSTSPLDRQTAFLRGGRITAPPKRRCCV
ncbi:SDR family NAD(P)-dependent oxidoreductase [Yoonia sp. SDW83-1]|uniref:SDR family NAD(P)-dependent oxidoreductase n=1 Tax=Yoonia sp. SDW83-1 TaxID=3366945 RepID=UPI00398C8259